MQSEPRTLTRPVWALSLSLAATQEIDVSFSSCGYLDVSVPRVPPRQTMDSSDGTQALPEWVSPFGYLRISGYLLLPAAFRSLSRPSSASGAKASALCSFLLNLFFDAFASGRFRCIVTYLRPCFSVRKVNCYAITETTRRHSLLVVPWSSNVCKSQASLIFAAALGHFPSN